MIRSISLFLPLVLLATPAFARSSCGPGFTSIVQCSPNPGASDPQGMVEAYGRFSFEICSKAGSYFLAASAEGRTGPMWTVTRSQNQDVQFMTGNIAGDGKAALLLSYPPAPRHKIVKGALSGWSLASGKPIPVEDAWMTLGCKITN